MCRVICRLIFTAFAFAPTLGIYSRWLDSWGAMSDCPQISPVRALAFIAKGCLAGGKALPLIGTGFQVMRPSRNRYYGHPDLIELIHQLGLYAAQRNARLLIGDLSQPRGGPMTYGHKSHQIGLDADIWLQHIPAEQQLSLKPKRTTANALCCR